MKIQRIFREGAHSLGSNKLRTFFMTAGTIVGIAALTIVMAVGKGTEKKIMKRVENFGIRAIMVTAGGGKGFSPPQGGITTLRLEDADAIRDQIDGIEIVTPAALKRNMSIKAGDKQIQASVFAGEPDWHDAWEWYAQDGDPIVTEDLATTARVCILGTTAAGDLFGTQSPVGEYVQIGPVRFLVKGVLERKDVSPMGTDFNNRLLIPLTTGLRRLFNQEHLSYIRVKVMDPDHATSVGAQIRQLLHERHHITPPQEDDFAIVTASETAKAVKGISGTLNLLLIALSGLCLLVGGVVLMNILLIAVGERQKEIGLRRAIGATKKDIMRQFLAESLAVTLLGMVLGCGIGVGISQLLAQATEIPVLISWEPFVLAVVFALLVGTFFGVQPARKAAALNPVEALR